MVCITLLLSLDRLQQLAATLMGKMSSTEITQVFRENLTKVSGTNGDILEVATVEADESFTRRSSRTVAWNLIYLGTTTSEIRVPTVFRYHIKLSDDWKVSVQDGHFVVIAPVIRPTQPPAIRLDQMEKKTDAGWARFNAQQNLAELERSIMPSLLDRSGRASHIDRVREPARKAVAQFARKWLLESRIGEEQSVRDIVVVFADEPAARSIEESARQPVSERVLP